jgi:glycosyltransferase involved in cell wall biosynthesis
LSVTPEVRRIADRLRPAAPPERPLKVFYWSASMVDGTWLYRIQMPMDELNRLGHEARASTRMGAWARDEADIIVGQRICQENPSILWLEMAAHRAKTGTGPALVYEVDDDLFNVSPDNPLGPMYQDRRVRKIMFACIRAADAVTVSTEPLAELLWHHNPNVHVIANAIRSEVLDVPAPARRGRDDGITRFGWQGSSTHTADWLEVKEPLAEVMRADPNIRMRFLGTAHPEGLPLDRGRVDFRDWTTDINEHYRRISRFDVTLAPLKDTVFNRSKSALRVQESLALGVPVVASDVPAYRGWVVNGKTGFLVTSPAGWRDAMVNLTDPQLRLRMGEAGRKAAEAWTIEANAHKWITAYRSLL